MAADDVSTSYSKVTLPKILASHNRVKPYVHRTPVLSCSSLGNCFVSSSSTDPSKDKNSEIEIFLKCENLQKIGAFKIRGACNAVQLSDADVICTHSSGNHAQACALACKLLGKKAIVVMPKDSPVVKVNAVRDSYGAEVRFCEPNLAARESTCADVLSECESKGIKAELVHPYNDSRVCCGQGTLAVELLEDCVGLDAVVISVGGGGLIAGCATAIKGMNPNIKVIAAEPLNADDCYRSFQAKTKLLNNTPPQTIADSVKTNLGDLTFPIILEKVDAVITVTEEEIKKAMRLTMERAKLVIEPGAAVAVAVACISKDFRNEFVEKQGCKKIGVVLCGGNLDIDKIATLVD